MKSAAELDHAGRAKVLAHMRACGWNPAPPKTPTPGRPRAIEGTDRSAQLRKIEALLLDAGRTWDYAHGLAKKMFSVERLDFVRPGDLHKLTAALEYDRRRRAAKAVAQAEKGTP